MTDTHVETAPKAGRSASARPDPGRAVAVLTCVLAVLGAVGFRLASAHAARLPGSRVPWWVFVVGFVLAELAVVRIEVRHESHAFSLVEVPLVLALFYATPGGVLAARLVGGSAMLLWRVRATRKVAFNLALWSAETVVAIAIFGVLAPYPSVTRPSSWGAAFAAVLAMTLFGAACVNLVIRLHGARPAVPDTVILCACAAIANTSLAVAAAVLVHVSIAGMLLVVVLATVVFAAYSGYTSLSRRYSSLQLLYDFTRAVGGAQRAEGVVSAILDQARRVLRADAAELVLLTGDDATRCYHVRAADGEELSSEITSRDDAPLWDVAVTRAEKAAIARHTKSAADRALLQRVDARDLVVAPLTSQGRAVGYLVVEDRMGELGTFDQQDARLLETLANHASMAIENGRLGDRLAFEIAERARQAATDALTGLANRSNFVERVGRVLADRRHGQLVAVMLMDLDHFKDVNDTLGHNAGDDVLCQSAARVVSALDDTAMVARLGGDEFAVLLPDVASEQDAIDVANVIRSVLAPPVHVGDVALEIAASVGIALAPRHGDDAHALLRRADIAMYAAKREQGVQVYDAASDEHSVQRLALVSALREAIDRDDLLVYFQPKVRVADEQVIGAEALVRWQHPTHGMLSPDVFISIAERTALIGSLTQLVARRAFAQCAEWRALGFDLSIAVNVSVQSLVDVDFPDTITRLLAEAGLQPEHVTLEITESTILDPKRTTDALSRLAALGVKLSVDDFGTGYSSLTYLQRLPVHEVKVDRSFVMTMGTNESDAAIVKSIIDLGHNLGLRVVAEGVEDRVAWDRLARQGCDIAQGYFMSKPIPAEAFTRWLREWEPQRVQPVAAVERAVTAIAAWR